MANPKRRHSQARRDNRRSQQRLRLSTISACPQCGKLRPPHRVCQFCGYYQGRQVLAVGADAKTKAKTAGAGA